MPNIYKILIVISIDIFLSIFSVYIAFLIRIENIISYVKILAVASCTVKPHSGRRTAVWNDCIVEDVYTVCIINVNVDD